jgi:hypothetical protein
MVIHLFDLKSEMKREGIDMMDFLENNFKVDYSNPNLQISKIFFVKEEHLCRPDLLSWDAYGLPDYVDIILKFNQITNPFSMDLDDFIVIPSLSSAKKFYQKDKLKTSKEINDTKSLFIDPTKASKKDLERLKQLEKIAKRRANGASEIKPTNLLRNGEQPYITDGLSLIFAPSVSVTSTNSQSTG